MKTMKIWTLAFVMLAAFSLASCSSDEPQWADPEAHEKTEQLQAQYIPFIVGTWHYEKTIEKQRTFEQLTFNADGTLSGRRKWQSRQVVTIGGQGQYNLQATIGGHFKALPIARKSTKTWVLVPLLYLGCSKLLGFSGG